MQNGTELYHYGVLGMKWGQRRYHNKYGGLTNAGAAKRKKLESEYDKLSGISTLTEKGTRHKTDIEKQYEHLTGRKISELTQVSKPKPKPIHEMTNEELVAYNTRKQLETTYQSYQPKPEISKGKKLADSVVNKIITPVAIDIGKTYLKKVASEKMNIKVPAPAK